MRPRRSGFVLLDERLREEVVLAHVCAADGGFSADGLDASVFAALEGTRASLRVAQVADAVAARAAVALFVTHQMLEGQQAPDL